MVADQRGVYVLYAVVLLVTILVWLAVASSGQDISLFFGAAADNNRSAARPSPKAPPRPPAYVVITSTDYGRFGNQREGVLEGIALSKFSRRSLLVAPLTSCDRRYPPSSMIDLEAVKNGTGVDVLDITSLKQVCSNGTRAVLLTALKKDWGKAGSTVDIGGMSWTVIDIQEEVAAGRAPRLPRALARFNESSALRTSPVYRDLVMPTMTNRFIGYFVSPAELPLWVKSSTYTCIAMDRPFYAVNLAVMPGAYAAAAGSFLPPQWLMSVADAWCAEQGVDPQTSVALHMRLTDMVGASMVAGGFAQLCAQDSTRPALVAEVRAFFDTALRGANGSPRPLRHVLFASDEPKSACVRDLIGIFPPGATRLPIDDLPSWLEKSTLPGVHERLPLPDCMFAQLVQELLARSVAFMGSKDSTFSIATHQGRVLRYGHAVNSSLLR